MGWKKKSSGRNAKLALCPSKFKEREKITKTEERGSRLNMYSRKMNQTTNQRLTRKNLSHERNIASKDLPILILLLTKKTA